MLRPGHVVILCALALLCIGVVMVNSAGMSVDPVEFVPVGAPPPIPADQTVHSVPSAIGKVVTGRPMIYMVLALAAMAMTAALPLSRLARIGEARPDRGPAAGLVVLGLGVLVLLGLLAMVYIPGLSREVNGSRRWIELPLPGLRATSIQPSEFVKWGLLGVVAVYCTWRAALMHRFFTGLLPALLAVGVMAGAVAKEDLGTGVLIAASCSIVLLAAGARLWQFLMFFPPAAAGFLFLVVSSPYRLERIKTFIDPYLDPQGSGYHMIQSMAAVAGGEGFGRGLGFGLQKYGYLPEDTTDFLFAIICEELGVAGAAVVIALYGALLWAGLAVVRKQTAPMLKLVGLGVLATVGLQALINLSVVVGLAPTKGIALPLISSGGTGWILTAASLGLLVSMDRTARREAAMLPPEPMPAMAAA